VPFFEAAQDPANSGEAETITKNQHEPGPITQLPATKRAWPDRLLEKEEIGRLEAATLAQRYLRDETH